MKLDKIFLIQCFFLFVCLSVSTASDRLDPYSAKFKIIPGISQQWSDIDVTIDFFIHNSGVNKLAGSKFVSKQNIESINLTDGEGNTLPFTVKNYPRNRIIWEYGPARDGSRRAKISFIIKKAVKKEGGNYIINIDWIEWKREVLNATISFVLPVDISKEDIIYAVPKDYSIIKTSEGSKIVYKFSKLNVQALKLVIKDKSRPLKAQIQKKESNEPFLENIRVSSHNSVTDRLVFELNRLIPFSILSDSKKDEVEIMWKYPLEISNRVLKKKNFNSRFVKGLYWKKTGSDKMSCIIQLKKNNLRIRYGTLPNPPRVYIDALIDKKTEKPAEKKTSKTSAAPVRTSNKTQNLTLEDPDIKEETLKPVKIHKPESAVAVTVKKQAPVEERIAYRNADKFFKSNDFLNAVTAYKEMLEKFPETVFEEEILFKIADCYYQLAEKMDKKYYDDAIRAYKKAKITFSESSHSGHADFRIAEIHRKRNLLSEAKSQYSYFIKKHPDDPMLAEARFWKAECLYQMYKFDDALTEFERFIDDFRSGPHLKEAMFRVADCYYKKNDFDRAEYYYEKAFKKWPDLIKLPFETLNNMGMLYYYKGEFGKCRNALFLSFNIYPFQENRDRLLRFIGDSYQWGGDMQRALNIYGYLISIFDNSYESMIAAMRIADLGVNVSGLKTVDFTFKGFDPYLEPEKTYRWIIDNDKKGDLLTEAFYKLGFTRANNGDYAAAVNFFKKSMYQKGKGPYHRKAIENIKNILVKTINMASSEKDYFHVVELYKKNEENFLKKIEDCHFHYTIGFAYLELGFINTAEKIFQGLYKKTDNSYCKQKSIVSLGRIDLIKGNPEKAEDRISLLLFGAQVDSSILQDAYLVLGDSYFHGKKYKEAVNAYSVALKDHDESFRYAKTLYRLGESFGRAGYSYNGIQALKILINLADQTGRHREELKIMKDDAAMLIGDYFLKKKNYKAAIDAYSNYVESTSNKKKKGWALFNWAEALKKSGNSKSAAKIFASMSDEMPYHVLGRLAQTRMEELEWTKSLNFDLKKF